MDIRIEKTKSSIINAFIELRSKKEIEKITIKELCELARINKSTFYAHYLDIYDLTEQIESEIIDSVVQNMPDTENIFANPGEYTQNLHFAFSAKTALTDIIFSGSRKEQFLNKLVAAIRMAAFAKHPEYKDDMIKNVILDFCIIGTFYTYNSNEQMDKKELVALLSKINETVSKIG